MLHVRGSLMQNCGFLSWNEFLCMLKVFNMEILVISSDVTAFGCRMLRAPTLQCAGTCTQDCSPGWRFEDLEWYTFFSSRKIESYNFKEEGIYLHVWCIWPMVLPGVLLVSVFPPAPLLLTASAEFQFLLDHPGLAEGEQGMIWRVKSHLLQECSSE